MLSLRLDPEVNAKDWQADQQVKFWALHADTMIGRNPQCGVYLVQTAVSRKHAVVTQAEGGWTIRDIGSTNGVLVNGMKVATATLRKDDRITIAGAVLIVVGVTKPGLAEGENADQTINATAEMRSAPGELSLS